MFRELCSLTICEIFTLYQNETVESLMKNMYILYSLHKTSTRNYIRWQNTPNSQIWGWSSAKRHPKLGESLVSLPPVHLLNILFVLHP